MRRRESFDEVAELYELARPTYPTALIDDLVQFASLSKKSRALEIGCGTGQLTLPLAERGTSIMAVELGANLAAVARRKLARFENVTLVVADFDRWVLPEEPFDLVVAATAFHWLRPESRVHACADALRPGGTLAIVQTHWSAGSGRDRFFEEGQRCYASWDTDYDPDFAPVTRDALPNTNDEMESSGRFDQFLLRRYDTEDRYTASQYSDLLATFSNIRGLDERARSGLLGCLAHLIDTRFGGSVVRKHCYSLWLARTPAAASA